MGKLKALFKEEKEEALKESEVELLRKIINEQFKNAKEEEA